MRDGGDAAPYGRVGYGLQNPGWAGQRQRGTGGACPAPTERGGVFFINRKPCGKQMPRPLGRAGIKSEKAGFRLKNRLIVIFEVKSGFFPPLWGGSRGTGPPGRGPRLAGSRLPSGLRRTALAVAGGACIWRSPVSLRSTVAPRAKPRITSNQRDFSRSFFWSQKRNNLTAGSRPRLAREFESNLSKTRSVFAVPHNVRAANLGSSPCCKAKRYLLYL